MMLLFAHHMGVELFGREYSPQTTFEHICVFAVLALLMTTSAVGTWTIASKLLGRDKMVNTN
ncbi:hypothetical protein ACYOEI_20370 [Singulisphaera rosea]